MTNSSLEIEQRPPCFSTVGFLDEEVSLSL
jgi:hypothetical protein